MDGGWHTDPLGRFPMRYFDGAQWTHHVADHTGTTQVDPLGNRPSPPPSDVAPERGRPWLRFLARVVDAFVVGIPLLVVMDAVFGFDTITYSTDGGFRFYVDLDGGESLVVALLYGIYEVGMIAAFGRTVGKWVCGLRVVKQGSVGPPGVARSAGRYLAYCIYLIPIVGWIMFVVSCVKGFSDPRGETIHDKLATTNSVSASTNSVQASVGPRSPEPRY